MKDKLYMSGYFVFNIVAFMNLFSVNVYAYIDPSAVSYVAQAVAGVVIAIGAIITIFRHKIAAFFKKGKTEEVKEIHFKEDTEEDK